MGNITREPLSTGGYRLLEQDIIPKKWGKEIVLVNNELYCAKFLVFNPWAQFSLHFHGIKDETWIVKEGTFVLTVPDLKTGMQEDRYLVPGNIIRIHRLQPHRLKAGAEGGTILEVSTTHEDWDSYRVMS